MSRSTGRVSRPGEPIIITLFSGAARTYTARRNSFSFPAREIAPIALPRLQRAATHCNALQRTATRGMHMTRAHARIAQSRLRDLRIEETLLRSLR